jgi:hypothetical protein
MPFIERTCDKKYLPGWVGFSVFFNGKIRKPGINKSLTKIRKFFLMDSLKKLKT